MAENEVKKIARELIEFLISRGHSEERATQIAGNHPDAVRADMAAAKKGAANDGKKEKEKNEAQ